MSADLDHCQNRRNCQRIQIEAMSLDAEACSAREGALAMLRCPAFDFRRFLAVLAFLAIFYLRSSAQISG